MDIKERDNVILNNVPNITLRDCKAKQGDNIKEYEFEHLTNIVIQEYIDYNMIILKSNVENKIIKNIKEVDAFIIKENPLDFNGDYMQDYEGNKIYNGMKLLLTLRDSSCGGITEFYYIFANALLSTNALKKELNWILDREISKKSASKNRNVDLDFETKGSLKDLNINLVSIQNIIDRSVDNLAKEIKNSIGNK